MSQLNDRDIALRRIELRRSFATKVVNARRMPPRNDSVDGCANRNPVSPSVMVSARPPGLVADRQRSELLCIHLAQSAWLEARRHQREIAAGKNPPGLAVVETDGDPDRIRSAAVRIDQGLLDIGLAAAGHDNLPAGLDDLVRGRQYEIDAFLMDETGNEAENRTA